MRTAIALFLVLGTVSFAVADDKLTVAERNWPQWRGPSANGIALSANPPINWGQDTNIRWKVEVPGEGIATPIVWEDQVFVVTAIPTDRVAVKAPEAAEGARTEPPENYYQFVVISFDRNTGKERWRRVACEAVPHEGRHHTNTYASASPATDGERLYVSFSSRGFYCYDLEGKLLWQRDLGDMRTRRGWGEATTPTVYNGALIITWDHEDQSFVTVLDAETGETRWKADRDEPSSWATPLVIEHGGRTHTIINATNRVRSYDLNTGQIIWECGGQSVNAIPSPVVAGDMVYCMSGYQRYNAVAIPLSAQGDITDSATVKWSYKRGTPYVPSPIVYDKHLYFTGSNSAVLTCLDRETGQPVFGPERLPGLSNIYASPVAAAGRIYFVGRDGTTLVVKHGSELEVLATNRLDELIDASPALVGKQMFLRGARHLYCIEETQSAKR